VHAARGSWHPHRVQESRIQISAIGERHAITLAELSSYFIEVEVHITHVKPTITLLHSHSYVYALRVQMNPVESHHVSGL